MITPYYSPATRLPLKLDDAESLQNIIHAIKGPYSDLPEDQLDIMMGRLLNDVCNKFLIPQLDKPLETPRLAAATHTRSSEFSSLDPYPLNDPSKTTQLHYACGFMILSIFCIYYLIKKILKIVKNVLN